jgi:hypothetical protein
METLLKRFYTLDGKAESLQFFLIEAIVCFACQKALSTLAGSLKGFKTKQGVAQNNDPWPKFPLKLRKFSKKILDIFRVFAIYRKRTPRGFYRK